MRRRDALMMLANGDGLRRLQEAPRAVGELFEVHALQTPLRFAGDMALLNGNTSVV